MVILMDLAVSAHPGITKSFPIAPLSFFHSNCCMTIQDKNRRATKDEVVIILSIDYGTQGLCVSNQPKVREASLSRDSLTITLHVKPGTHCSGHPEQLKRRSFIHLGGQRRSEIGPAALATTSPVQDECCIY